MLMLKVVQYGLGIGFILIGIAGLFLPLLQGILFIVLGIFILRAHSLRGAWETLKEKAGRVKKKGMFKGLK